jgi:hypothetical protein
VPIAQYEHYVFVENTRCNEEERMKTKKEEKDRLKLTNIK